MENKPPDLAKYVALFKAEADEQIARINQGLLSLEKNPQQPKVVEDLFRAAHTLKGSARMMGFLEVQNMAHTLEESFERIKKKEITFESATFTRLFKFLDAVQVMVMEVVQGKPVQSPLPEAAPHLASKLEETIRIPVNRINAILNLAGELVIHKGEAPHLEPVIEELQYKVRELRMLPCSTIFGSYERLVRDVAQEEKKMVEFVLEGEDAEIDKKMLEAINPCLIHLLRNAVSHGIELPRERKAAGKPEKGRIRLSASQHRDKVVIQVQDDGRGIDPERIKAAALEKNIATEKELSQMNSREVTHLIFRPGFSTASVVTDVSGRGVGLDVVRQEIQLLKGHVEVVSVPGQGTTLTIELPLSVAVMRVLLVEAEGEKFGIPLLSIDEVMSVTEKDIQTVGGQTAVTVRDRTVPVYKLAEILEVRGTDELKKAKGKGLQNHWPVVLIRSMERQTGLMVKRVLGEEEIFIKTAEPSTGKLRYVSGAAVLGTGEVIVILDVEETAAFRSPHPAALPQEAVVPKRQAHILVIEDSMTTRELERNILEAQGYAVETAVDGIDALEKVSKEDFDLVVADIQMPRMDGFEFCKTLRQQPERKDLPVVFVTALEKEEERRRGIEVGAQAYIVKKDFKQQNLLETIERLIP